MAISSANAAALAGDTHRLLGHPVDLAGHTRVHGPLDVVFGRTRSWRDELISSIEASGLTGRGGGAFPTSIKLAVTRSRGRAAAIIVNGMEGEPVSHKDKVLLTRAPHLVLDGAQYLAALCGATRVVVCIPAGREGIASSVLRAISERAAERYSVVPEEVVRPPDRFVAGEESALVNWIATGRSAPQFRTDKGSPLVIGRRPVLVQNTETLAHVALIARNGPGNFRARGTAEEPGTCLVTIGGAVADPGVVEVDRGTPLWDIVTRSSPVESVQALLVGGYGGTWVAPAYFATPHSSISLRAIGASAGVGVLEVLGASTCGIAETSRIARYLAGQSAGQCGPCVLGLPAIADVLEDLAEGHRAVDLIPRLNHLFDQVNGRGACSHPDGAVRIARSALGVFADDVAAHTRGVPCGKAHAPTAFQRAAIASS
jgi:NADH:ubiquinone oxidoreductase subunit F (NADH-binding)